MSKRPTLLDVAKLAGVSRATAARVVNGSHEIVREETRKQVMKAVQQIGYERNAIAGSLRSARTYMIALSIPDITNPFWPEVARGVQDAFDKAGYTVVLMNNDWNASREKAHLKRMRQKQFDGLIINPTDSSNSDLTDLHIPVVVLGSGEAFPDIDTVGSDSVFGGKIALSRLVELGHQRIALIAGPIRHLKSHHHRNTYIEVCRDHGLTIDPELIVESPFSSDGGYAAMSRLLELDHPPTAVFAVNDMIALGALTAAQVVGVVVPHQLSIVGMDDIFASVTTYPRLTTVAKPKYQIGTMAAQFLIERIEDKPIHEPRHIQLDCNLVERDTTSSFA